MLVLLATALITALGLTLTTLTDTEVTIAANATSASEALYAADAAVARVIEDLAVQPSWTDVLTGAVRSTFSEAAPILTTRYGERLDLPSLTGELQTETDAAMRLGVNTPQWQLFASGPVTRLAPGIGSLVHTAVWVGASLVFKQDITFSSSNLINRHFSHLPEEADRLQRLVRRLRLAANISGGSQHRVAAPCDLHHKWCPRRSSPK